MLFIIEWDIFGLLHSVAIANPSSAKFFSYSGNTTRGGVKGEPGCVVVVVTRRDDESSSSSIAQLGYIKQIDI